MEGCIKQWLGFVKPNFTIYVKPQRDLAGGYLRNFIDSAGLTIVETLSFREDTRTKSPST